MKPRDYAFEALAEVTGSDPAQARGPLNAALKAIREQAPELTDSYLLADEIHTRAKLYRQVMPDVMLTCSALAKHWQRVVLEAQTRASRGTNLHAASDCSSCGGERFVIVGLRKAAVADKVQPDSLDVYEEWAACPDCGPNVVPIRRPDGSLFVPPDPATVRERMNR